MLCRRHRPWTQSLHAGLNALGIITCCCCLSTLTSCLPVQNEGVRLVAAEALSLAVPLDPHFAVSAALPFLVGRVLSPELRERHGAMCALGLLLPALRRALSRGEFAGERECCLCYKCKGFWVNSSLCQRSEEPSTAGNGNSQVRGTAAFATREHGSGCRVSTIPGLQQRSFSLRGLILTLQPRLWVRILGLPYL